MKALKLCISITFFTQFLFAQKSETEILEIRNKHHIEITDSINGLLTKEELASFKGLSYFDFDSTFQFNATFKKKVGKKFKMHTSTERLPIYRKYGYLSFTMNDSMYILQVYQNVDLIKDPEFKNYLFVPFRDLTSGKTTYGGGRYLDLTIPESTEIVIDFNLAYNPYCAYSHRYSCPIPPKENSLNIAINAGEQVTDTH